MFFDEFQSETNTYCDTEIEKFMSIHTSVARGGGKQVRYVPVIMCSNPITLLNPYYTALNISNRINSKTKFLRGKGYVFENGFNDNACVAQMESGFNKAFAAEKYLAYSAQGVYLNDNKAFVEKMKGRSKYVLTIRYKDENFAIRQFPEIGVVYCDKSADLTYPYKVALTTSDHNINYVLLKSQDILITNLRYYFDKGCFRFRDLKCKEMILKLLSY